MSILNFKFFRFNFNSITTFMLKLYCLKNDFSVGRVVGDETQTRLEWANTEATNLELNIALCFSCLSRGGGLRLDLRHTRCFHLIRGGGGKGHVMRSSK